MSSGAFGNKNGSWVLDIAGLMEGALLVWSEFAKGFCTGALGRTINFQVVASGSQHYPQRIIVNYLSGLNQLTIRNIIFSDDIKLIFLFLV